MAISRQQKEQYVEEYTDKLSRSHAAYITNYRGLTVSAISDLRSRLHEQSDSESEFAVAKNSLLRIAFEKAGLPVPDEYLQGPTAVLFCFDDPVTPAKVLKKYSDDNELLSIKGGVMGTDLIGVDVVEGMANLPSREEIFATLVGAIQGPAQSLFGTITAPQRELVQVLQARAEGQGQEG